MLWAYHDPKPLQKKTRTPSGPVVGLHPQTSHQRLLLWEKSVLRGGSFTGTQKPAIPRHGGQLSQHRYPLHETEPSLLAGVLVSRETPQDVIVSAAKPPPTVARMRAMTMFQLFCGEHLKEAGRESQQQL